MHTVCFKIQLGLDNAYKLCEVMTSSVATYIITYTLKSLCAKMAVLHVTLLNSAHNKSLTTPFVLLSP